MEEVHDELAQRLTLGRSAQKKFQVQSRGGLPAISITYDSTPDEVRAWLEAKGFSRVWVATSKPWICVSSCCCWTDVDGLGFFVFPEPSAASAS